MGGSPATFIDLAGSGRCEHQHMQPSAAEGFLGLYGPALSRQAAHIDRFSTAEAGLLRFRLAKEIDLPRQHHARRHQGGVEQVKEKRSILHRLDPAGVALPGKRKLWQQLGQRPRWRDA
jgi:hypothetical protein